MGNFRFVGGLKHDLSEKPFMMMDYGTVRDLRQRGTVLTSDCLTNVFGRQKAVLAIRGLCATNSRRSKII